MAKVRMVDSAADVEVTTTETTVLEVDKMSGMYENLMFQINNTGAVTTNSCIVYVKASATADYVSYVSTYGAETAKLLFYSGNLASNAAAAKKTASIYLGRPYAIKITMTTAATSTTVTLTGILGGS